MQYTVKSVSSIKSRTTFKNIFLQKVSKADA